MRIFSRSKVDMDKKIKNDIEDEIEDALDADIAAQIVDLAISTDGTFEEYQFMPKDIFFDTEMANKDPKEIAEAFFYGKDLDSGDDFADPTKDFLRLNKDDYAESTDYPGDIFIYEDNLLKDIIDYIIDNMERLEFPDEIQKIIDKYLGSAEE